MKNSLKAILNWLVKRAISLLLMSKLGKYIYAQIINFIFNRKSEVNHQGIGLVLAVPNALNQYRADTFSTKEPETLEWIDRIDQGAVLWDIGANVGLYSCYSAKSRNCRVIAFEPSVFNLEILARNIYVNKISDKITILPLPLTEKLTFSTLNMSSVEWGGALSTFGENYGHDGEVIQKLFEFPTIGLSMDEVVKLLKIPMPAYIKMDVDGIEHLILKGGTEVLRQVKEVLIEINDKFEEQAYSARNYLLNAGLVLKEKRHAEYFDQQAGSGRHTFNQIWVRETK